MGHSQAIYVTIEPEDESPFSSAEPCSVFDERFEHRLEIERRPANHLKNFTRCRLLLESLAQVAVAGLEFLEEADVLDGDHGLVRERLEQFDLLFREGVDLGAPNR